MDVNFKIGEYGIEYLTELPAHYIKMPDLWQLFILIDKSKGRVKDNVMIRSGITLLIHDPYAKEYYPRYLCEHTNREALFNYFQDGNLYISRDDII